MTDSGALLEKAGRLIGSGALTPQSHARVFTVEGNTGRYVVVYGQGVMLCTCEAGRYKNMCSHLTAVALEVTGLADRVE